MKKWFVSALVIALMLVGNAAFAFVITFDENGNGLPYYIDYIGQDNGPGGLPNALIYQSGCQFQYGYGDLVIFADTQMTQMRHVVRFFPNGEIAFYSNGLGNTLADVGFPTQTYFSADGTWSALVEEGPSDGFKWVDFTPNGPRQPGWNYGESVSYHIISDTPVPEPGSLLALGSGLLGLAGFRLRKRLG